MATIFEIKNQRCLKSGIDTRAEVLPNEESADLERLTKEYTDRFRPATPEERFFVDLLIRAEWRLRRFAKTESERLQKRIDAAEISYVRALRELERLQAARPHPEPPPQLIAKPSTSSEIGFVPSNEGQERESASIGVHQRPILLPAPGPSHSD